jgi:hypothetical protein
MAVVADQAAAAVQVRPEVPAVAVARTTNPFSRSAFLAARLKAVHIQWMALFFAHEGTAC